MMPSLASPTVVWTALFYFAGVIVIGVWAARRTRDARDFFIAGQKIGLVVTGFATMSAAFSGFVFIGGPGLTYRIGLASLFICIPLSLTAALLCWVVAKRLRLLAGVREIYTVPDVILARFGSRTASGLAACAILIGTVGYLGAQLKALGILIEAAFGTRELLGDWSLPAAVVIGMIVVLVYATAGGMVAGVYTDLVQGALMVTAAILVFSFSLEAGGGLQNMARSIASSEAFGPAHLDPLGSIPVFTAMGLFFVFTIGTLGQPHMLHKFFMLDDPRKLKWMPMVVAGTQALCILIWLGIGLAVPSLVASGRLAPLANPDDASIVFLLEFTPDILAGLVIAGVLAAIMSTADSFVNIGSAAVIRDLPKAFGRVLADELHWGRLAVAAITVSSAVLAVLYGDLIALLGTFAFGTFAAALGPVLAVGLNWRSVTPSAAAASIATGMGVNLVLEFMTTQTVFDSLPVPPLLTGVLPSAVALAASFSVLFAVTACTRRGASAALDDDVDLVMDL
jgi:Na+/proline symporter